MASIDLVLPFVAAELRTHLDPWFWLSQPKLPYWWLAQRAVVAGLVTCGLSPLEIEEIRRGPLPAAEAEALGRTSDFDGDLLHVRGARARRLPLPAAIAGMLEHAAGASPHRGSEFMFTEMAGGRLGACGLISNMQRHAATREFPDAAARWRRTFLDALAALPYDDGIYQTLRGLRWEGDAPSVEQLREAMMAIHPLGRPYRSNTLVQAIRQVPPLAAEIRALTERRELPPGETRLLKTRRFREVCELWHERWFDGVAAANFFGVSRGVFDRWVAEAEGKPPAKANAVTRADRDVVLNEFDPDRFGGDWEGFHAHLAGKGFHRHFLVAERILREAGFPRPEKPRDRSPGLPAEAGEFALSVFDPELHRDWRAFHADLQARHHFPYRFDRLREFLESKGFAGDTTGIAPQDRSRIFAEYDPLRFRSTASFSQHLAGLGIAIERHRLERMLRGQGCETAMSAWRRLVLAEHARGGFDGWQGLLDRLRADFGFPYCQQTLVGMLKEAGHGRPKSRLDPFWRVEALRSFDAEPPRSYQSFHARLEADGFPYGYDAIKEFLQAENRVPPPIERMSKDAQLMVTENYDAGSFRSLSAYHAHLESLGFPYEYHVLTKFMRDHGLPPPARNPISRETGEAALREFDRLAPVSPVAFHRHMKGRGFRASRDTLTKFLAGAGRSFAPKKDWRPALLQAARRASPIRNLKAFHRELGPPISYAAMRLVLAQAGVEIPTRGPKKD